MKFLRDAKNKIANSKLITKLKGVKNLEIVLAVLLAAVAVVAYVAISVGGGAKKSETQVQMTEAEARVAEVISEISGVGKTRVLITNGADKSVVGVVVVAEGASNMDSRVKMIRLVEKATGATVDQIEIFEMAKGG
ncbi:MAG: hypothetical protein J5774_00910 [Clostridia bacterium]|nr:hypothetical protein [Clostridia bacterium]